MEKQDLSRNTVRTAADDTLIRAMSFNVLAFQITDERKVRVLKKIEETSPDTLALQEATVEWVDYLAEKLRDSYGYVDNGPKNNFDLGGSCAVFYRKDKFALVDHGTYWLSDTPDVPSMFPETRWTRVLVYALLERRSDKRRLLCTSSHMENNRKMVDVFLHFAARYAETPITASGDFNILYGTPNYHVIAGTRFSDAAEIAAESRRVSTCHAYKDLEQILDYFFVTDDMIKVERYDVLDERVDGEYASDHHPIMIEYHLGE